MADEPPRVIAVHIVPVRGRVIFARYNRYLICRNVMADEPPRVITGHIVPVRGRVVFDRYNRYLICRNVMADEPPRVITGHTVKGRRKHMTVYGLHCLGHAYSFSLAFAHLKCPC
ncbi:hypothetical protein [Desulfococcus sp.]|uniref:hypothetical protein n=1 Tax=Desulfococcus sp. TaxID=2025834 RepID=UPI0035931B3C